MNALEVFLFTNIEERGRIKDFPGLHIDLEDIANVFLAPLRVLWHGRTVRIVRASFTGNLEDIYHVASFRTEGKKHSCRTLDKMHSSQSDWVLTTLAVFCLIPGLLIGLPLKVISHAWDGTRKNYKHVCNHFSRAPVEIGTKAPVSEDTEDLCFDAAEKELRPLNKKVSELIIHGDGQFVLTARGDLVQRINPKKIILIGTSLFRGETPSAWRHPIRAGRNAFERVVDHGREITTGAFLPALIASGKFEMEGDQPKVYSVKSLKEAQEHTPQKRANGKPFHALYQVTEAMQ